MKNWFVSDIRWASERELNLPIWKQWNRENPLPNGFWQRIWEYPYFTSRIPKSQPSLDIGGTYPFVLFKNFPLSKSVDNRDLNLIDHPYHTGKWPKDKLIVSDAANVPVADESYPFVYSISAIEEMPHTFEVLKEMIRIAKHRVVVTLDVSDSLGLPYSKLRELEKFLGVKIPEVPIDALVSTSNKLKEFGQSPRKEYHHIRVLAFTLDAQEEKTSVGVLIPHWESWSFLKPCVEAILKYDHPNLQTQVYILDDSSKDGSYEKALAEFGNHPKVKVLQLQRPNKASEADVGLLLDMGLIEVKEQYVAMVDADLFPLSLDWLMFPIWLLKKYGCSSVGLDTGLSSAYSTWLGKEDWWQPNSGYAVHAGLYQNQWFTCSNNLYRVMNTGLAQVVSEQIGFTRATPKNFQSFWNRACRKISKKIPKPFIRFVSERYPYLPGGCDNGVAANHFIDINHLGAKFNIPITSYIGLTPKDGAFGQNISGLAFHFALSTRALSKTRREVNETGEEFSYWAGRLQQQDELDHEVVLQMIEASIKFKAGGYDGSIPVSWYEAEYQYIQELLNVFHSERQ